MLPTSSIRIRAKLLNNTCWKNTKKMIEKQKGLRKTVPPGLNAEYGFLLCKLGKKEEGIKYLKAEMALYPESATYVSRIIKQLEK